MEAVVETSIELFQPSNRRPKNLTNEKRRLIVEELLKNANKRVLHRGEIAKTALKFNVCRRTVSNFWKIAMAQLAVGDAIDIRNRKKGKVGKKPYVLDVEKFLSLPLSARRNIRSLALALGISICTVHRLIKEGQIRVHTSAVKPFLTDLHKRKRLEFCLSKMMVQHSISDDSFLVDPFYDCVHLDEKWFYMQNVSEKIYLHPTETDPHQACKSKRFITKVMFTAAVARPRFGPDGAVLFDGKIGIFPFIHEVPAKCRSKNREAGVLEIKPIDSINKEVIKQSLLDQMLPALKAAWPSGASRRIFVQQDDARPHLGPSDADWMVAANADDWEIDLCYQPLNSPDLNILDLGFFNAIQSLKNRRNPKTVEELVTAVTDAYNDLDAQTLNFVWLSYQQCMIEVLKHKGSNSYKLPHMGKSKLLRQGLLPSSIAPDHYTVHEATQHLAMMNEFGVIEQGDVENGLPHLNI